MCGCWIGPECGKREYNDAPAPKCVPVQAVNTQQHNFHGLHRDRLLWFRMASSLCQCAKAAARDILASQRWSRRPLPALYAVWPLATKTYSSHCEASKLRRPWMREMLASCMYVSLFALVPFMRSHIPPCRSLFVPSVPTASASIFSPGIVIRRVRSEHQAGSATGARLASSPASKPYHTTS